MWINFVSFKFTKLISSSSFLVASLGFAMYIMLSATMMVLLLFQFEFLFLLALLCLGHSKFC